MALRLFTRTMPRRVGLQGRSQQPRRSVMLSSKEEEVSEADRTIAKPEVERFISECMTTVGTEDDRAKMLAANLTEADYRGNCSSGIFLTLKRGNSRKVIFVQTSWNF